MTNPTLERAARAVCRSDYLLMPRYRKHGAEAALDAAVDDDWQAYVDHARAVLRAVREPDEATIESLFQARDGFVDRKDIAPLHRLVIDFALGESNETDDLTKSAVVSPERG